MTNNLHGTNIDKASDSIGATVEIHETAKKISDVREEKEMYGPSRLSDIIPTVYQNIYNLSQLEEDRHTGFNTGFSELDKLITGLNRSDLIAIGARPAMGKTSFALNLAKNIAVYAKKKVLFFSLEVPKDQLSERLLFIEARVKYSKFRAGRLTSEELQHISEASVFLSGAELYFDDTPNITVPEIKAKSMQLNGVDCVVIDCLQLMKSGKKIDNRFQEMTEIVGSLKMMAKELNIPVVICTQLSRNIEKKGLSNKPTLSALRHSGSIEQDADIVLMLHRESYYSDSADISSWVETAELIISKNRHGATGTIPLAWHPDYMLFTTKKYNSDEDSE